MDLLTTEEYKSIAANLELPTTAYIDGGYRPAASGETFTSTNPATGETLAEIASCGQEDVDFAVEKAREAFDDGRWSKMHPIRAQGCADPLLQTTDPQCARVGCDGKPRQRQNNL